MQQQHFLVSKTIIAWLLVYNLATWFTFASVYMSLDFGQHFKVPDDFHKSWDTVGYFAWQIQTQMFGTDIVPKTSKARAIVAVQGLFAWSQTIVFLAPWILSRRAP